MSHDVADGAPPDYEDTSSTARSTPAPAAMPRGAVTKFLPSRALRSVFSAAPSSRGGKASIGERRAAPPARGGDLSAGAATACEPPRSQLRIDGAPCSFRQGSADPANAQPSSAPAAWRQALDGLEPGRRSVPSSPPASRARASRSL